MLNVEQVKALIASGKTDAEVAAECGSHRVTVQKFRARHGIAAVRPVGLNKRNEKVPVVLEYDGPTNVRVDAPKKTLSVSEFLLNKRKAVCPVCQLKEPVKAAVLDAKKKGERTADILEYLQVCHRVTIEPRDYQSHFTNRHDQ